MKYAVVYVKDVKRKNKMKVSTRAVFYDLDDAARWENHLKSQNITDIEIIPVLN